MWSTNKVVAVAVLLFLGWDYILCLKAYPITSSSSLMK